MAPSKTNNRKSGPKVNTKSSAYANILMAFYKLQSNAESNENVHNSLRNENHNFYCKICYII